MGVGAAIVGGTIISGVMSNQAQRAQAGAISDAGEAQAQAMMYATDAQMEMFNIARQDLAWASDMGRFANADIQHGALDIPDEMRNYQFSDAPTLSEFSTDRREPGAFSYDRQAPGDFGYGEQRPGEFSFDRESPGEFSFDREEPGDFEFNFNVDDEIFKWKQQETQRLVDQKMAAMGNMNSTANLTQSRNALMNLMSNEVEEQFSRQWTEYTTNATEFQNSFGRALATHGTNMQDFNSAFIQAANTYSTNMQRYESGYGQALSTHQQQQSDYGQGFSQELTKHQQGMSDYQTGLGNEMGIWSANQQNAMNQYGMTNAAETNQWNQMASLYGLDASNIWNRVNTGLAASGQSAQNAMATGGQMANTYMQGGANQANTIMAQGQNTANYYSGQAQLPWMGMSMYNQYQYSQPPTYQPLNYQGQAAVA